jgi:threonine synthase
VLDLPRLGRDLGLPRLLAKHEGFNPTGSFKDRGMAVAIQQVVARGGRRVHLPSAGNAAASASAYGNRAGVAVEVAMPTATPEAQQLECRFQDARVKLVGETLRESGQWLREHVSPGSLDLSTLREPFRLEGKKTMGYELWEQGGGTLPDAIVYPTGGGTGLIGMWKAFAELAAAGQVRELPRMIAVQAAGCAPIVAAHERGAAEAMPVAEPSTFAAGLRVPQALGDRLILSALRESGGTAIAVPDADIRAAARLLARLEGVFASPEAAATIAALAPLRERGELHRDDRIVVFLTASGLKNVDDYRD